MNGCLTAMIKGVRNRRLNEEAASINIQKS